jgi:hypothetical protein
MDCVTPSHETAIPHGESLDIYQLLAHPASELKLPESHVPTRKHNAPYTPRKHVLAVPERNLTFLEAQITRVEKRSPQNKGRRVMHKTINLDAQLDPVEFLKSIPLGSPWEAAKPGRRKASYKPKTASKLEETM